MKSAILIHLTEKVEYLKPRKSSKEMSVKEE